MWIILTLIISRRSLLFLGGFLRFTNSILSVSPEWPKISYWILSSNPSKASITKTTASNSRSSLPSYELNLRKTCANYNRATIYMEYTKIKNDINLYMLPETSTTSLKSFGLNWGVPSSGSWSALLLYIVFSPNKPKIIAIQYKPFKSTSFDQLINVND